MNDDTWSEVFKYIPFNNVLTVMLVCKQFNNIFNNYPFIWQYYLNDLNNDDLIKQLWTNNWKSTFKKYQNGLYLIKKLKLKWNVKDLYNLPELHLYFNQLNEIPKEIGNLINLQILYLYFNQLNEIPKEIGNLINLQRLYLQDNQLTEIPKEIGNLINLQYLNLNNNQLSEIPKEIGNLINLQFLLVFYLIDCYIN